MKIDIICLCDFAQYNEGKMTIVGTLNQINGYVLPARSDMYFVSRLSFEPDEELPGDVILSVMHETSGKMLVDNHVLLPKADFKPYEQGKRGVLNMMLNLNGFVFPYEGTYVFRIKVGDVEAQTYLDCVLHQLPQNSKEQE